MLLAVVAAFVVAGCSRSEEPVPRVRRTAAREERAKVPGVRTAEGARGAEGLRVEGEPIAPAEVAKTPVPRREDATVRATRVILERVVRAHALDPDNGWALAHALVALGGDAALADGTKVVDHLFRAFGERGRGGIVEFPATKGGERIEPHPGLLLKAMAEAGVDPGREVVVQGRPARAADLWRGTLDGLWVEGARTSFGAWNDAPWMLHGVALWAPDGLAWRTEGHDVTLDALANAAFAILREETAVMRQLRDDGRTASRRTLGRAGKLGLMAFTCGGAHYLQGVGVAFARGFGDPAAKPALGDEASTALWRLSWEVPEYDAFAEQIPELRPQLRIQRLKFLGHLLETAHTFAALGLFVPTDEEKDLLDRAVDELGATVALLERERWFAGLGALRRSPTEILPGVTTNEQIYLDTVGDASHALHGLDLATGRVGVRH